MDGPVVTTILQFLGMVFGFLKLIIIASVIISWVNADQSNFIVRFINGLTGPIYAPFRKLTQRLPGPLDWAPLLALFTIFFLELLIRNLLQAGASGGVGM